MHVDSTRMRGIDNQHAAWHFNCTILRVNSTLMRVKSTRKANFWSTDNFFHDLELKPLENLIQCCKLNYFLRILDTKLGEKQNH
jgi:hypothetical protein